MEKSLGFMEYQTVSAGITAADQMVKTAEVELLEAQTLCPGKYVVMICGKLSAVQAAVEKGKAEFESQVIDSFILGNPHESILKALRGTTVVEEVEALGIIETFTAASIIVAADIAAKTAQVELIEIRIARGMCGKSFLLLTGELAAVEAAVGAACSKVREEGMLLNQSVIARPDKKIWEKLL